MVGPTPRNGKQLAVVQAIPFFVFVKLPENRHYLRFQQTVTSHGKDGDERLNNMWAGRGVIIDGTRNALLVVR